MSIRNVKIKKLKNTPPFRKVALGTWDHPGDPQIYGCLEVDLTKAYVWRDRQPKAEGERAKITVMHMVARAMGLAMKKYPDLNGFVRFKKIYMCESVDMFFQVAVPHESGRTDLTGVQVTGVDEKGVQGIADAIASKVNRVRTKKDSAIQKTTKMLSMLPGFLVRFFLSFAAFISYTLNIRFPGVPKDSFGAAMITNVGSIGLDKAWAPLVPYSRVPLIIALGQAKPRPVVIDGELAIREIVTLNATIDHRFCDGALLAKMVRVINQAFDDPDTWFSEPEPEAAADSAATDSAA